jgi:hypothetical protein
MRAGPRDYPNGGSFEIPPPPLPAEIPCMVDNEFTDCPCLLILTGQAEMAVIIKIFTKYPSMEINEIDVRELSGGLF